MLPCGTQSVIHSFVSCLGWERRPRQASLVTGRGAMWYALKCSPAFVTRLEAVVRPYAIGHEVCVIVCLVSLCTRLYALAAAWKTAVGFSTT